MQIRTCEAVVTATMTIKVVVTSGADFDIPDSIKDKIRKKDYELVGLKGSTIDSIEYRSE